MNSEKEKSSLFLTVNTNSTDDKFKDILKKTANEFIKNIGLFLVFRGKYNIPKIFDIHCEYALEKSSKGFNHTHILVNVIHSIKVPKDKILINLPRARQFFNKRTNRNCYVNCKFAKDNAYWLKQYLNKN